MALRILGAGRRAGCVLGLGCLWLAGSLAAMTIPDGAKNPIFIRLAEGADDRTAGAARDLSAMLERIFSAPFPVTKSPGETGILLGTVKEFPDFAARIDGNLPGAREAYVIQSSADRIHLVGASSSGVQNAVWDFLDQLGYRQYFPGETWEIVPHRERFEVDLHIVSSPSFAARRLFVTHNIWPELREEFQEWQQRNRLDSGIPFSTGHSYNAIIDRHREELSKNPGYLSRPIGIKNNKFIVAEKGLRDLVVADALAEARGNPDMATLSLDPSDGGNWPESSPLGSVSDQAVTLANEVASALQTVRPGIKVAMYAYSQHSPPPSITVNPNVVVSVATAFLRDGFTFEELMQGWSRQGASLGVRDYLGVWAWTNDLPGRGRATSPAQVAKNIARFYALGARYYTAECNHGFGAGGLGLYTAARCLWDVRDASRVDEIRQEFLDKSFGSAREAMAKFYKIIDGDSSPLLSDHLLGGMYRALAEAYDQTADAAVINRIDDLAAYARYVELFTKYSNAEPQDRQQAFDVLAAYGKRIRSLGMAHTWALLRNQPKRDPLAGGSQKAKNTRDGLAAFPLPSHDEFRQWVQEGIANHPLQTFQPVSFSEDLVPLPASNGGTQQGAEGSVTLRGENSLFTYLSKGGEITFSAKGGSLYGDRGPIRIKLYPLLEPLGQPVAEADVPADKSDHVVKLESTYTGLHRIEIKDGNDQTSVTWPASGPPLAVPSGPENFAKLEGRHAMYFYVPKGTRTIAGYSENGSGALVAADGSTLFRFSGLKTPGYFNVPVPAGQDGRIWKLDESRGKKLFMTIPPFLFPSKEMILVPQEVSSR